MIAQKYQLSQFSVNFVENKQIIFQDDEICCGGVALRKVPKQQMNNKLHKNIVSIVDASDEHIIKKGSGLLISPNLVLTCAHNLINSQKVKALQECIEIYHYNQAHVWKLYRVETFYIPPIFPYIIQNQQRVIYDYALIKLTEKVPSNDFISLGTDISKGQKLAIYGYPSSKYQNIGKQGRVERAQQWGLTMPNHIIDIQSQKKYIRYSISTQKGQSGSPIIKVDGDVLTVIGIHKGCSPTKKYTQSNWGRLITNQLIQKLKQWAIEVNAQVFRLESEHAEQQLQIEDLRLLTVRQNAEKEAQKGNQQQNFKNAAERYIASIGYDPKYNVPYNKLRILFTSDENTTKQILYEYQIKQTKNPKDLMSNYLYATVLRLAKKINQSKTYYRKAIQIDSSFTPAYNGLGIVLYKTDNLAEAIIALEQAIKIDPKYPYPYTNLCDIYTCKEKKQKAMQLLQMYMKLNPEDQDAPKKKQQILKLK